MQALPPAAVVAYEIDVSRVQEVLGEEAFTAARNGGRALPLEAAVAEALAVADEVLTEAKG